MRRLIILSVLMLVMLGYVSYHFSYAFFTDSAVSDTNTFTAASVFPTPTISPGDVVINEINWGGSNAQGGGTDEWLELRNTTSHQIDIGGWIVENLGTGNGSNANITIPAESKISGNGFFLISNNDKTNSAINVDPDYVTTAVSLNDDGEQLTLKTATNGAVIDIANGTSKWFAGSNSAPKKSMERKTPPGDGTVLSNWQTATTHTNMDGSSITDEFGTPNAPNGL